MAPTEVTQALSVWAAHSETVAPRKATEVANPRIVLLDVRISTDGSCGGETGSTCLGSEFGDCCSAKGWCGGNSSYCDIGCQGRFGKCSPAPASTNSATSISETAAAATAASSPASDPPVPTVQSADFKAGIAVASTVASTALLSLALFLFRRRQRLNNNSQKSVDAVEAPSENGTGSSGPGGKVYASELSTVGYYQEMPNNEKARTGC
ncbi:hypothetical protein EPUS_06712 [Endocarpon pusillum Z07020]|uniref:Chitin-binding type-1 domain-containing protein n=1 Tax=Endocarpon pusillum (strain Z07020 / HMAS-L-300199) TaxID=1263415 RepID=U1HFX8_ENDPU|nr:uncharacterized protein EPUS_06712 [Endocarpon pusillum Z07020]ERF69025.1 hypothetical protein EPUS_06712 [Endocarpon pusillum Z07020]